MKPIAYWLVGAAVIWQISGSIYLGLTVASFVAAFGMHRRRK